MLCNLFQLDFNKWKSNLEEETVSLYKMAKGEVKGEEVTKKLFYCNRSGSFQSRGKNIRNIKIQGTRKCEGKCPSTISMTTDNITKKVSVCFVETHAGHLNELKHIDVCVESKKQLASQIKLGIPYNIILQNIRNTVTDDKLKRVHLVRRKDLDNITESFNLNSYVKRHSDDATSLEGRINELSSMKNNPILYYKKQGAKDNNFNGIKEDDFLLAIMNEGQKYMFLRFAHKCVAIDSTHGTNAYDFQLTTLMILDEQR